MNARRPVDFLRVNGLIGDPAVYTFFQRSGAAVLFDAGELDRLPNRDLLRVKLVLVSHTHIDHFIGFDRLLRVNIPHGRTLEVVGPKGMIANVQGKLRGYLWNLLEPDQIQFIVHEVDEAGQVLSAKLANGTGFAAEEFERAAPVATPGDPPLPPAPVATFAAPFDGVRFEACALDHKTSSIAYACQLPCRLSVKEDVLAAEGLRPGPWIRELQIAHGRHDLDQVLTVDGRKFRAGELSARLFAASAPRPVGYLTDAGFTPANLARARQLLRGVQTFICETNYRDAEIAKAHDRMHLTTRQAALIAAAAGVEELEIFHVSNIYVEDPAAVVREAAEFFAQFKALAPAELEGELTRELARAAASHPGQG